MGIIETASDLYALLHEKETLHVRQEGGRDDALYHELKRRLGCPEQKGLGLETWLKQSSVSGQAFLAAFFAAAQPLSAMYKDIYAGMRQARVVGAPELARIRLEDEGVDLDLDLAHFATTVAYLEKQFERRTVLLWDDRSVNALTDVVGWLLDGWRDFAARSRGLDGHPEVAQLPATASDPDLADELRGVREVLVELAHDGATGQAPLSGPLLFEVIGAFNEVCARLARPNPQWRAHSNAMAMLRELPYAPEVRNEPYETAVEVFRKVLDLPLWRYRWYLYEVWTAFRLLHALEDYAPIILVDVEGRIALARGSATQLARFRDDGRISYAVAVQKQTPVQVEGRTGICPDYRLERERDEVALLLVECKQRGFYFGHSLDENMRVYEAGAPASLMNLFVNYDAPGPPKDIPARTRLVEAFRPGVDDKLREFDALVRQALARAGIRKPRLPVVLLDNSGSMEGKYLPETHEAFWTWFEDQGFPRAYRFSDDFENAPIVPDALTGGWSALSCKGGTRLEKAISGVAAKHGPDVRVLLVTDLVLHWEPEIETHCWNPSAGSPSDVWPELAGGRRKVAS